MPTLRHLNAVAHDIAHHAVSGLSYVHPHLSEALREVKKDEAELDLLAELPLPPELRGREPLDLSTQALRGMFHEIVRKKGYSTSDIQVATLRFYFSPFRSDDYTCICWSRLVTVEGREFTHRLGY